MNISTMILDNNPITKQRIKDIISGINTNNLDAPTAQSTQITNHSNDNFRDAISTITHFKIDVILINIASIDINRYQSDCLQLRNIYAFSPVLGISDTKKIQQLDHYNNKIGFDDILDIEVLTSRILLRVLTSAIHRSKTYHQFHTNNQRNSISNQLLKLLLNKNNLLTVANSAIEIIHSNSSELTQRSVSIFTFKDNEASVLAHIGEKDDESSLDEYKKRLVSLKKSTTHKNFKFLKKVTSSLSNDIQVSIPLINRNETFAILKIETKDGLIHPSEERKYYKDLALTLSDVLVLAQEREIFELVNQQNIRLIDQMSSAAIGIDNNDVVTHWNHQSEIYFGLKKSEAMNIRLFDLKINCDWPTIIIHLYNSLNDKINTKRFEVAYKKEDSDKDRILSTAITPFVEPNGKYSGYLLLMDDITEKKHLEKVHQQSMYLESIGQLSAGIAHEINTPMQYISDNLSFLRSSFNDATKAISSIQNCVIDKTLTENKLNELLEEADFEYLNEELPLAFSQTSEGVSRVCAIVKAMKEYSHPNSEEKIATDINKCIESTITISKHTWKYHSNMEVELDTELPAAMCHPGPLNEVILNIIVNAADAIKEHLEKENSHKKGLIKIVTKKQPEFAEISISDTGGGIPQEIQNKIFDPFFTTKDVGKGTGQGLALSYSIIKERHGGELFFDTIAGKSTTFTLQIPYQ